MRFNVGSSHKIKWREELPFNHSQGLELAMAHDLLSVFTIDKIEPISDPTLISEIVSPLIYRYASDYRTGYASERDYSMSDYISISDLIESAERHVTENLDGDKLKHWRRLQEKLQEKLEIPKCDQNVLEFNFDVHQKIIELRLSRIEFINRAAKMYRNIRKLESLFVEIPTEIALFAKQSKFTTDRSLLAVQEIDNMLKRVYYFLRDVTVPADELV
jgi:hypothetical protein